jgi:hypothetical protein
MICPVAVTLAPAEIEPTADTVPREVRVPPVTCPTTLRVVEIFSLYAVKVL